MSACRVACWSLSLTACAAGQPSVGAPAQERALRECARQLPERVREEASPESQEPKRPSGEASARPEAREESRIIAHLELPLAKLAGALEQRVGRRLAEERDLDIGPAGALHYAVDREALAVSIQRGTLVVEAPIRARAEACSGGRCYASCEPSGVARVELPLALRADYRFDPSRASFRFTRGCRVRILGGFLSVDVTPTLEAQARRQLKQLERDIDRNLPDVHAEVERAYRGLATPLRLPIGGCVALRPLGVVQGPVEDSKHALRMRIALRAEPELLQECVGAAELPRLPPLERDLGLPEEGVTGLDMIQPLSSFISAFERAAPADGEPWSRIRRARIEASGKAIRAELMLTGETCGTITVRAEPAFTEAGRSIALHRATLEEQDRARARSVGLDTDALARSLVDAVRVSTPLSVDALRAGVPLLGAVLSRGGVVVQPRMASIRAAGAEVRDGALVARVEARGSLNVVLE